MRTVITKRQFKSAIEGELGEIMELFHNQQTYFEVLQGSEIVGRVVRIPVEMGCFNMSHYFAHSDTGYWFDEPRVQRRLKTEHFQYETLDDVKIHVAEILTGLTTAF